MRKVGQRDIAKRLAQLAHRAAIQEIGEIQQRQALRTAMVMHGVMALPLRDFMRRLEPRNQTLAQASELCQQETDADVKRLSELYPLVEELEEMFARYHEAKDEAWATAMADYFKQQFKGGR